MKVHFLIHLQIAMLCGFDEDALDLLRSCVERLCEEYNARHLRPAGGNCPLSRSTTSSSRIAWSGDVKLHDPIRYHLDPLPAATRDATEGFVMHLCEERRAHSLLLQQAILRLVRVQEQEFALENFRLGETDNVRHAAAKITFHMLAYGKQMAITAEITDDIATKALRYFTDASFAKDTQERLAAAGHPRHAVEREVTRLCIQSAPSTERLSLSLSSRYRAALKALLNAEKLAKR
jgi:hypothetical protein